MITLGRDELRILLESLLSGKITVEQALEQLTQLPYEDLGYARLDHHRELRKGFPEVVFCQGKQWSKWLGSLPGLPPNRKQCWEPEPAVKLFMQ